MNLISPKLNYVFPLKWWHKSKTHHSEIGRPHHLRLHSGLLSWTLGYYSLLCLPTWGCSFFKCWEMAILTTVECLCFGKVWQNKKAYYEGRDSLSPPMWLCSCSRGRYMGFCRFAFPVIHQQILRLFLFLLVLAVLVSVSSRVDCNNYKLNYNKNTKQGFLEPKPTS